MEKVSDRDYNLLGFITIFFMIGIMGTRPLVPILGEELGETTLIIGIIVSLFPLLPLFLSIQAGQFIDKTGSKYPLLLSAILGSISILIPFLFTNIIGLVLSQIVAGISNSFFVIAAQSYVGRATDESKRNDYVMKFSLGAAIGTFIGPTLGGVIADVSSTSHSFLILSTISLTAVILTFFLTKELLLNENNNDQTNENKSDVLTFFKIKNFRRAIFISTLILAGKDTFTSFFPLVGVEKGFSSSSIGVLVSINALAGIFIRWALPMLSRNLSQNVVISASIGISGLCFLILPLFEQIFIIGLISFILGLGLGLGQPLSISTTLYSLPQTLITKGLGIRITANRFVQMTSPLIFGYVANIINLSSVFCITGFFYILGIGKTKISRTEGGHN